MKKDELSIEENIKKTPISTIIPILFLSSSVLHDDEEHTVTQSQKETA